MLSQNRGNSVSGDLKCKNFLGGCPQTPLERIGSGGQSSLSGYLEIFSSYFKSCGQPCVCSCKILYHMWAFSLFSKSHIGHVNHGKSENICVVGVSPTFLAVFLSIFCGVAVFRTPQCPPLFSRAKLLASCIGYFRCRSNPYCKSVRDNFVDCLFSAPCSRGS